MSTPTPEDRAALQREIQAAIAAGRDLDPEMDQHLADSALERYTKEKAARERAVGVRPQQAVVAPHQPNPNLELIVRTLGTAVIIGGIIFAIVFTHGAAFGFWWLIFVLGPVWGWRGRHHGSRRYSYTNGYQAPQQIPDEDARRREREAQRQAKIDRLEAEIKQLKRDDYV
ncbi:MAG: hypothetical protein H0X24_18755 [Ktedonobacterales bacterium]|nr:hypothetical protein [Ktedonobacterales bacterium]